MNYWKPAPGSAEVLEQAVDDLLNTIITGKPPEGSELRRQIIDMMDKWGAARSLPMKTCDGECYPECDDRQHGANCEPYDCKICHRCGRLRIEFRAKESE